MAAFKSFRSDSRNMRLTVFTIDMHVYHYSNTLIRAPMVLQIITASKLLI